VVKISLGAPFFGENGSGWGKKQKPGGTAVAKFLQEKEKEQNSRDKKANWKSEGTSKPCQGKTIIGSVI